MAVNRPSFLFNPTSCSPLATESVLGSTFGASQSLSSPFQVGDCGALAFKPGLSVVERRQTLESRRCEHRGQSHPAGAPGQHPRAAAAAAQAAGLAPDHAPESVPRRQLRSAAAAWELHEGRQGRHRHGLHAGATRRAVRSCLLRLPRQPGIPRPGSGAAGRRHRGGARRPHPHLSLGHHHLDVRKPPGRADLERDR